MERNISEDKKELTELCDTVRLLVRKRDFEPCEKLISDAMGKYPHAPEPHNLIGILLEADGNNVAAMKHFRAAWSLDPTYIPVRHNLDILVSFYTGGKCAFDERDCPKDKKDSNRKIEYDKNGVGRIVRRD